MNMHIKQMYAAAKIVGIVLTIAAIKTNWLSCRNHLLESPSKSDGICVTHQ